jgi:hypothetical protein
MKIKKYSEKSSSYYAAIAATFVIVGHSTAFADKEKVKVKDDKIVVKTEDGKAKIDKDGKVISVKGEEGAQALAKARAVLTDEEAKAFGESLKEGYVVPQDRYVYLEPVPQTYVERIPNRRDDVEYRVYNGTVYAVNPKTYTIVEVVGTDIYGNSVTSTRSATSAEAMAFKNSLRAGYVVPREQYSYFEEVPATVLTKIPAAGTGVVYRYYDGTVYSVNPDTYTIIDVVTY